MKTFETIEQAKESLSLGKRDYETVLIDGKKVTICGTCLVYEDMVWNAARELFEDASNRLGYWADLSNEYDDSYDFGASLVRDAVIEAIEKVFDCKIEHKSDTY